MVERFFRDISENRLRRGVFTSVPELIVAIDAYIAHHNANPKPFIWTTSARDILQEVIRANSRLSPKQNAPLHRGAKHLAIPFSRGNDNPTSLNSPFRKCHSMIHPHYFR
ncbi:MAG: hypothetical protein ABJA60_10325 [Nitrosospira sp.]